ncbi:hypothetical protein TeGR_g12491 [Tetraparma gracilis]|uniref:CCR4-NOT transcription complex subunit 11 n=1 Tax=Tetraparma gracilis TaxID=2962635 RepID=A0ABQ6MVQ8_9STRA|nr:hypothetical protein TeGR_g12491 [Tetraparma gracilis]
MPPPPPSSLPALLSLLRPALSSPAPLPPSSLPPELPSLLRELPVLQELPLLPSHVPHLVAYHPHLASLLLAAALTPPYPLPTPASFLSPLLSLDLSLRSLDVISRLALAAPLPEDFVSLAVSKCVSAAELERDKHRQSRLVRLVCVFLQSLLRNGVGGVEEMKAQVEAFCIEFSRIREAATLYKLLKARRGASH